MKDILKNETYLRDIKRVLDYFDLAKMKEKWEHEKEETCSKTLFLNKITLIKEKWLWCTGTRAALSTV